MSLDGTCSRGRRRGSRRSAAQRAAHRSHIRHARLPWASLALALLCGRAPLAAGQPAAYGAHAHVASQAPIEDATAAADILNLRSRKRDHEDIAHVLQEVPAVHVRRSGGAGSFASAALRGADADHTAVLFGALPLDGFNAATFDLSAIPLGALDQIEVFRGAAPAWYSEGAIGGVLHLVPRRAVGRMQRASFTVGPYGLRSLRATLSLADDTGAKPAVVAHLSNLTANNDYAYADDNQTRFDASDDFVRRQRNADVQALDGFAHGGADILGGRLELLLLGHRQREGLPGPLTRPTRDARQLLWQGMAGGTYLRERLNRLGERLSRLQWVFGYGSRRNQVRDRYGELGLQASDTDDRSERGFMRLGLSQRLLPFLEGTLVATFTHDAYDPQDALLFIRTPKTTTRSTWAMTVEPRLFGHLHRLRFELRPSVRLALSRSMIHGERGLTLVDSRITQLTPTYRLAGLLSPAKRLNLLASIASGTRLSTLDELFGDRVSREANPELSAERSISMELGATYQLVDRNVSGAVEVRGFALSITDLIQYVRTSQYTSRPENIASASIRGLEAGVRGRLLRYLTLASSLTLMHSENQYGLQLPLRPPIQALVRPGLRVPLTAGAELNLFGELQHLAAVKLDRSNLTELDGRTLVALGVRIDLWGRRLSISAQGLNLFDTQVTDVLYRPLPGRQLWLTLSGG